MLCRQVPQLFRSHRFHPGPQMPINSIPKRYYGYYEERKILEQELLKDLDKLQDGDEEEFVFHLIN